MNKILATTLLIGSLHLGATAQSADTRDFGTIKVPSNSDYFELYCSLDADNAQNAYENFVGEFVELSLEDCSFEKSEKDSVYAQRLKMLATEVQLPYNPVVSRYMDVYSRKGGTMEHVLGMGQYYFPIFEQALYNYGLPLELKMLPVIESALIPVARSHASAVGLWQMMMATAKAYGLEITSFVDERQDPVKSTDAACRLLRDYYKIYGDWTLVIAAYNCGPGNVNKAMKRAGKVGTYWDIYDYLPRETRGHVPAFIGASYGYTFYKAHSLTPKEFTQALSVDTLMINRMVHFDQIATTIPITKEDLRVLNPQYRIDIIPALEKQYSLVLPTSLIDDFMDNELTIYSKDTAYLKKYLKVDNLTAAKAASIASGTPNGESIRYKIKNGDSLGAIAQRYGVKVADIKRWNNLSSNNIRAGKYLTIYPKR